ncbi:hypothetical protein QQS21_008705 [Conoideocrella luteorostrata]|uniref:DNA binding domain with preference for A/T rich regions-like protein n=1 Tax=Conoideocrella luteorostrata TaxID=1105319 RepID=A0AAJ0FQY1_9HYPO|nr:hypothetical protein QQS21_008705 [Conoideocrella luteorostrata]
MTPTATARVGAADSSSTNINNQADTVEEDDIAKAAHGSNVAALTARADSRSRSYSYEPGVLHDTVWRSGVPSAIQHIVDSKTGNFAVMQLGLPSSDLPERVAAAKRTSEGTLAASKSFNKVGYQPLRKLKQRLSSKVPRPRDSMNVSKAASHAAYTTQAHNVTKRTTVLSPPEVKIEQARLLTLLRSLNPVTVVDQICKGLAYFGGVPMAAPPVENTDFPRSDWGNGLGSNFVGWLAEIFPNVSGSGTPRPSLPSGLSSTSSPIPQATQAMESHSIQPKKRRGRPKGSKSSKVRSDKGKKHSARKPQGSISLTIPTNDEVEGEGDIETDNHNDEAEPSTSMPNHKVTPAAVAPDEPCAEQNVSSGTASLRKRGRPKGSKNRGKNKTSDRDAAAKDYDVPLSAPDDGSSASNAANIDNSVSEAFSQLSGVAKASQNRSKKRKPTQQSQGSGSEANTQAAGISQTSQSTKRRRVSNTAGQSPVMAARPTSLSSSFDSQTRADDFSIGRAGGPQEPQLGQFFIPDASKQQRLQLSPNTNQARPGPQVTHGRSPHDTNIAKNSYYNQQARQQASHQMLSINPSTCSISENFADNSSRFPQHQPKQQATALTNASVGIHTGQHDTQSNQSRQSADRSSNNTTRGSFSQFNSQGFI